MPVKDRGTRSAAPSASPAPAGSRSSRSRSSKTTDSVSTEDSVDEVNEDNGNDEDEDEGDEAVGLAEVNEEQPEAEAEAAEEGGKLSMKERMEKMKELRGRMVSPSCLITRSKTNIQNQSTAANRRDLIADHQKSKVTAKELARLEKQRKLAQTLRLKAEAEEDGVDMERKKNWEWSIEENERWQAKVDEQKAKADSSFHSKLIDSILFEGS
jgi:pre-mRNA-splicing factor SYF2